MSFLRVLRVWANRPARLGSVYTSVEQRQLRSVIRESLDQGYSHTFSIAARRLPGQPFRAIVG